MKTVKAASGRVFDVDADDATCCQFGFLSGEEALTVFG